MITGNRLLQNLLISTDEKNFKAGQIKYLGHTSFSFRLGQFVINLVLHSKVQATTPCFYFSMKFSDVIVLRSHANHLSAKN